MNESNGQNGNRIAEIIAEIPAKDPIKVTTFSTEAPIAPVTRTKQRARQQIQQNRFVILAGGAIVFALLIFAIVQAPKRTASKTGDKRLGRAEMITKETDNLSGEQSLFPIVDSGRVKASNTSPGRLSERDLEQTATRGKNSNAPRPPMSNAAGTLGSIPPFGDGQNWQAPPYQPGTITSAQPEGTENKTERELEKPSLVYVRTLTASGAVSRSEQPPGAAAAFDVGLGLTTGTRLRARLESVATTAVQTPILAVIEYNYERNGEIIVPAGAKAIGRVQDADRSGYMRLQFDSLLMPDGATVPIQAAATDLEFRPLKGKVEGKNTGKNVLVRSLSGIGQAGALLIGRSNLNQPFSEGDLLRERMSSNIGEAGDEQISKLAITQHIVVTIPADTPIYGVFEQAPRPITSSGPPVQTAVPAKAASTDELRQLLQLQRELNQGSTTNQ